MSTHFSLEELTASQTAARFCLDNTPSSEVKTNLELLCTNVLEPLRFKCGRPITISSGYRSIAVNQKIGGSGTSQHCLGMAVDFTIQNQTVTDTVRFIIDNGIEFDQLIHEVSWTHCSFNQGHNRKQVLKATFDKNGHASYTTY